MNTVGWSNSDFQEWINIFKIIFTDFYFSVIILSLMCEKSHKKYVALKCVILGQFS